MKKIILIVVAHPDDEILGMGGTIARHVDHNAEVYVLYLSDGVGSRGEREVDQIKQRRKCAYAALEVLGANNAGFRDFPDNQFDCVPLLRIVKAIEEVKSTLVPDIIYTHYGGDLNIDHQITCQAVLTAFRPQPSENCTEILSFEVCSSTEWAFSRASAPFMPDTYVDISKYITVLKQACRCYDVELRDDPHARSIEAVLFNANNRGRTVGVKSAEAFMTLRRIIK